MYKDGSIAIKEDLTNDNDVVNLDSNTLLEEPCVFQKFICTKDYKCEYSDFIEGNLYEVVEQDTNLIWIRGEGGYLAPFEYSQNCSNKDIQNYFKIYSECLVENC